MQFTDILLLWYAENKRSLPWRGERDVYRVWVSEIILQQTRIQQGWDYYLRFIQKFPDIKTLAEAEEEQILRVWQGLGYYSRARNMHAAAQCIMQEHDGKFPTNYEQVRQLKGIGDYTAAAICAFAYGMPHPAVDGNVLRIISRIYGIHDNIADNSTRKAITELCRKLMTNADPADFNQALMDFGSLQCTPKNPDCDHCPMKDECFAFRHQQVDTLPVNIKHIQIKKRYLHYFVCINNNEIIIEKRENDDIWKGLYQLPMTETKNSKLLNFKILYQTKHQLTHQTIHAFFYDTPNPSALPTPAGQRFKIKVQDIDTYAFPKLIVNFFNTNLPAATM